jgi:precorrin-8X/cobalt-precorrin-8 methylmutase
MKRALLIVDRGSREAEVREELRQICTGVKTESRYYYSDYCFLEVVPPCIEEGINKCLESGADAITVVPYFLYPGMKLKDSVKQCAKITKTQKLNLVITKPLSYHPLMTEMIRDRIRSLKNKENIQFPDRECDILLIGHGSSDKNARNAFVYAVNTLKPFYRSVGFCFLELDKPDIDQGISGMFRNQPKVLILMPYFLHKGAHIKYDVATEVTKALTKYPTARTHMTDHLGVDKKLIDLVIKRAAEVEKKQNGSV